MRTTPKSPSRSVSISAPNILVFLKHMLLLLPRLRTSGFSPNPFLRIE